MISFSEALLPQKFVIESKEMRVSFHIVRSCSSKISATKVSFESQSHANKILSMGRARDLVLLRAATTFGSKEYTCFIVL